MSVSQPLADENQVLLQRAGNGASAGSSFGRQFFATVKRQFLQKKRMPCSMCLEIFLPIIFIAGLVLASKAANITTNPALQFVAPDGTPVNQEAFAKNLVCYNGTDQDLLNFFQPCAPDRLWIGTTPEKEPSVPANFFADGEYYFSIVPNFDDWQATWGLLSIDDLVGVQWAVRILFGGPTSSVFAYGTLLTLRNSGRIFLIPNNTQTRSLSAYFGTKYATWKYIHNEATDYYNSREEATKYLITVSGEGKAWALVELLDEQNASATAPIVDYRLSMNLSSVVDTTQVRRRFSGGLGGQSYRAYYVSGFLSLQSAINEFFLTQVLGATASDLPESLSAAPMGYASYKNSTFLTIAGNLCPLVLVLAFLYSVSQLAKRIVEEKEARLREGTMIMGLGKTAFFCSWLFTYFVQVFFTTLIVTLVLKAGIITESDPTVIFALYFLFGLSTISLSTLLSSFFSKSRVTAMAVPFLYFLISIPSFALPDGTSAGTYQLLSIFSPTAFSLGAKLLFQYEIGSGMGWNEVASPLDTVNMATVLSLLIFDTILYLLLTLYLDEVLPSEWGTKRHACFCCMSPCCCAASAAAQAGDADDYLDAINETSPKQKMKPSRGRHDAVEDYPNVGKRCTVHMRNLRKEFSNEQGGVKVAVDDFDLQLFDDQVTVLLGHNGAGKTTTMNMLTGMLEMTRGDCIVYGKSVRTNLRAARSEIGFCPQHNILWPSLTCMEHLLYFAALKGLSGDAARDQALLMLKKVDLLDKKDYFSKNLSGGQKRKLSVAIAFIGGSRLILLDEPTAGMDVAARRHTWDLLREMSAGRTIVLTTHYMDEADLLGNRVAIMSKGALHSYGSPMFLKARLGTGYVMRLSFERSIDDPAPIVKRVQEKIAGASLKEHKGQEVAVSLPIEAVGEFAHCIKYMEDPALQKQLGMNGISMSVSTLEDVFVRIALEEEAEDAPPPLTPAAPVTSPHSAVAAPASESRQYEALDVCYETKASANPSVVRQLFGLLRKRWCNTKRDRRTIVIQVFLPLGSIILAMLLTLIKAPDFGSLTLDLGMYGSVKQEIAFANCGTLSEYFSPQFAVVDARNDYPSFNQSYNFSMHLLDTFKTHGDRERFVSASCNDVSQNWNPQTTSSTVLFTNSSALHSLPQILNEYYNAIARRVTGKNSTLIRVASYPLPFTDRQSTTFNSITTLIVGFFILIPFTFIPSTYVSWVVKERECKAKHLQFVSGVNFIIYWASNFIFDLVSFLFTEMLAIVVFAAFGRSEYVDGTNIPVTIILFMLYGVSAIAAAYCISFLFDNHSSAQTIVMLGNFLCGFVLVITMYILKQIDSTKSVAQVLVFFFRFVPAYCLGEGILALASAPSFRTLNKTINVFDMDQAGWGMTYMAAETIIFSILTILLDHPSRQLRKQQLLFNEFDRPPAIEDEDEDVKKERAAIETNDSSRDGDVVRVTQLRKVYPASGKSGEKLAVKNLTFGVKKGEVFGFLGTNGAGKTTTMSVLTGEFLPTMGHCSVGGFDVVKESAKAKQVIGYCPQFDALLDLLTPEEHLYLYAALRDIPLGVTDAVVNNLLSSCALESYRKVPSKSLSGGNKRKLSVAISLMGGPKIVFLDEPSAGMDPHARRQLWDVIIYVAKHSSVVLTTHHLEEVDVLAHRVGIMVDGEMKCLGSLDHLKRKFGGGFEITIKASSEGSVPLVEKLISEQFKTAKLVEERQQRMTYALPFDRTKMSYVFDVLQKAKQSGRFGIADYTVQQTSLEQVFLRISNNEIMSRKSQLPGVPLAESAEDGEEDPLSQRAHSSFFLHEETSSNDAREVTAAEGDVEMKTETFA